MHTNRARLKRGIKLINDEMQLTNQLCFSIYNASRLFNKFYQQALEPFALTYPQYLVLLSLWEHDEQNLHELGTELNLNSNTLTPLLKRLEKAGWVARFQPESDRRQLKIKLTPLANEQQKHIYKAIDKCVSHQQLDIDKYRAALAMNNELVEALAETLA